MISDVEIRRVQTRLRVDITIHKGGGFYWRGQLKVCKIIGWLRFKSKKKIKLGPYCCCTARLRQHATSVNLGLVVFSIIMPFFFLELRALVIFY